jgi:hypothetical protein
MRRFENKVLVLLKVGFVERGAQKKRKFGANFKEKPVFNRGNNNIKKNGGQQSTPVDAPRKPTRKPIRGAMRECHRSQPYFIYT